MGDNQDQPLIPTFMEIPVDEEDPRFSLSFDPNNEGEVPVANASFDRFGFVIFRNVLTKEECDEQFADMTAFLQEQFPDAGIHPETWARCLSHFGCPRGVHGLFRPALLRLRQHEVLHRALTTVMGTFDYIVNHDRWLLHRPPPSSAYGEPLTKRNLHLDMNPWEFRSSRSSNEAKMIKERLSNLHYSDNNRAWIAENNDVHHSMMATAPILQVIVNLRDITSREHGGTILIPGSHKTFDSWFRNHPTCVGPMQYQLDHKDSTMMALAQHPKLRAGSVIVWDQRLFHGSTPNVSFNYVRAGIPLKAFSAQVLREDPQRATERGRAIQAQLQRLEMEDEVTEIGRQVFGLDLIDNTMPTTSRRQNGNNQKRRR